jgi:hypothetical protein
MKQLLLIAFILFGLNAGAQTIKIDSTNMTTYVDIDAVTLDYLPNTPAIDRLYIDVQHFSFMEGATFHYALKYRNYRPDSSYYYLPVGGPADGTFTLRLNTSSTIASQIGRIYNYTADTILNVNAH